MNGLLAVFGVLAGITALLYLMTVLDPVDERRKSPSHKAPRSGVRPRMAPRAPATPVQPIVMPEQGNTGSVD